MKSTFAIAAFAGVAVAAPQNAHKQIRPNGKLGNDQGFLQFMGVFNQHASTQDKFETMQANYHNEMNNINNANRYCDEVDRSARCPRQKVNFTMGPSGPGRVRSGMMRFLCGRKGHRFGLYLGANLDTVRSVPLQSLLTSAKERDSERGVVKERRPGPRNCTSVTTRTGWTHIAPPIERQLLAS